MRSIIINTSRIALLIFASAFLFTACEKETGGGSLSVNKIDPGEAPGNEVLTLTGSGLRGITSIVFDNGHVPASFNPNFNTDNAVIFRVPDTANGGDQNIILTNVDGKQVSVPFRVIALVTVAGVSNYNFEEGSEITITGNNLDDVSKVLLTGTTTEASIVSQSKRELVISMPATDVNRATLDITNNSGTVTTTQEFVNMDKALKFFTDSYGPGFQDASWGDPGTISNTVSKSGNASVFKKFAAGNWHQFGFGWNNISNDNYTYLSFWIKGASKDYSLYISSSVSEGGFASFNDYARIAVPANVWTYFKIPVATLKLWANGSSFNQLGWRIQGPDGQDETFYLDDVILVK